MITQIDIEFIRNATTDDINDNKYDKIKKVYTQHTRSIVSDHIYDIPLPNKRTLIYCFKNRIDNLK